MGTEPTPSPIKLAIGWLTMFLIGSELFVCSPLLPLLAADYHISLTRAGSCVTVFSLTYMVSAPILGLVSDRIGRRRVLIGSLIAFGVANLLTASAGNLWSLLVVRLIAGAAAAGVSPSVYALVGATAPPDRRASWLAMVVSGLLASLALGASAGAWVGASFGWAPVFIGLAGFSLILVWLNCQAWPRDRFLGSAIAVHPPLPAGVLVRRLMPMVVWSTGLYGMYTYLGAGLVAIGFSAGQVARAILFYGGGAIVGALIGGHLADSLGSKYTAGASLAGLCVCFCLLILAFHAEMLIEISLGLSATVSQLFFPAQQAGLVNDFPTRRSTVLAWNNSALFLGIALGSFIGGEAVAIGSFSANLVICASILLIGSIINGIVVPESVRVQTKCKED